VDEECGSREDGMSSTRLPVGFRYCLIEVFCSQMRVLLVLPLCKLLVSEVSCM